MACASDLADAGLEVTILEAKKQLGGRAYSFRDKQSGTVIDNCQHIILGCCDQTIGFLTKIKAIGQVHFEDSVRLVGEDGEEMRIKKSALPPPLHLTPSILGANYLSGREKVSLVRIMKNVRDREVPEDWCAADYLKSIGCSGGIAERLLSPVLVSALNEFPDIASASCARMVLTKTLMETREGYRLGVPIVPLSEIFDAAASRYLIGKNCKIRTGATVEKVEFAGESAVKLELCNADTIRCDYCVSAVAPSSLPSIGLDSCCPRDMVWRPIVGAHLFFEEFEMPTKQACLVNEPFQWVFDKSRPCERGTCISAVGSAAEAIVDISRDEVVELAIRSVSKASGGRTLPPLKSAVVYRAGKATFGTMGARRPSNVTHIPNLFLAGDWTNTGWPATMESAVRSGRAAARALIESI